MEYTKEIKENVYHLTEFTTSGRNIDEFFTNIYPNLNVYDQAVVLSEFQKNINRFNLYLNRSKEKKHILEQIKSGIDLFIIEKDLEKSLNLLPIVHYYTSISINNIDSETLLKPFEKISFLSRNIDLIENETIKKVLINITKIIAYATSSNDDYKSLLGNANYKYYEEVVCNYIEKIGEDILDDELINLLVETLPAISSTEVNNKLKNKIKNEINLEKYNKYILDMIPLDDNIDLFFDDIKKYRIQNNIIPENICIYINKLYSENNPMLRLCNIDLIRHYLMRNKIENTSVFYDDSMEIGTEGLSGPNFLSIKKPKLGIVIFHEATHVIQFNNQENDRNYTGYNYSMLKDTILHNEMDPVIYNRNHNRYLFEIDADICGEREYYKILEQMNMLSEDDKKKKTELKEKENFKILHSYYLNINGYNYEKGILFDDVLLRNTNLLTKYPVLEIEYNKDGSRKELLEILKSLENELIKNQRTEEEIIGIANCIFGEFYEVENVSETLRSLTEYVPQDKTILQVEKNLISELQILQNQVNEQINQDGENINRTGKQS